MPSTADTENYMIGLRGSATNDRAWNAQRIGLHFYDAAGSPVGIYGDDVMKIRDMDLSKGGYPRLRESSFYCGQRRQQCPVRENGATAVFGPRRGLPPI
jgi:glycerate kinase